MSPSVEEVLEAASRVSRELKADIYGRECEALIDVVRLFERVGFDMPETPDADGFLFQYGEVNWLAEPAFTLGFTRQLERVDGNFDHQDFIQVHFEYQYPLASDLGALGSRASWWFRGAATSFERWLQSVSEDPVWDLVDTRRSGVFSLSGAIV